MLIKLDSGTEVECGPDSVSVWAMDAAGVRRRRWSAPYGYDDHTSTVAALCRELLALRAQVAALQADEEASTATAPK